MLSYSTTVTFGVRDTEWNTPLMLMCTCPVGSQCKHGAALLFALLDRFADAGSGTAGRLAPAQPAASPHRDTVRRDTAQQRTRTVAPEWRRDLSYFVDDEDSGVPVSAPLGLQFELIEPGRDNPYSHRAYAGKRAQPLLRLGIRPVVLGKTGSWIRTGVSWRKLLSTRIGFRHDQCEWMQVLYALCSAIDPEEYYYSDDSWVMLDVADSPLVWDHLQQAQRLGIPLVQRAKKAPAVQLFGAQVHVEVDAVDAGGATVLRPRLTLDGAVLDPASLSFMGSPAHALYLWDGAASVAAKDRIVSIARLSRPLPDPLKDLVVRPKPVEIPADDREIFEAHFLPNLRKDVSVVSSDESIALPAVHAPTLVLTVSQPSTLSESPAAAKKAAKSRSRKADARPEVAAIALSWAWRYGDEAPSRVDRDREAERGILESIRPVCNVYAGLLRSQETEPFGVFVDGTELPGQTTLRGTELIAFLGEGLTSVDALAGVRVERDAGVPDYREAIEPAEIRVGTEERDDSRDWFDLVVDVAVEGEPVPFEALFVALATNEDYLILPSGTYFSLADERFARLRALIEEARALGEVRGDSVSISRYQAGLWGDIGELGIVVQQADAWKNVVGGLASSGSMTVQPVPDGFNATLRPYQQDGYDWLSFLYQNGLGGVLADDMGLGKTVQTLALIAADRAAGVAGSGVGPRKKKQPPFLVVAPASVVSNWGVEAGRFTPGLAVATIEGTESRRGSELVDAVADADIVLTSYALFRLEFDAYQSIEWAGLILDEAQFAKNHQSRVYACARMLNAPFKLAITGTPMENNLMELWSLFSIVAPGLFGGPENFGEYYRRPIEKDGDAERLDQLRRRIRPLMMRRTKELVAADLPPKQEQVLELSMNPAHRAIYDTYLQRERQKVLGLIDDMQGNRFQIFSSLTLLRQAALDVSLVDDAHAGVASTKIDALSELLEDIVAEGHRTLIFSQFTTFLGRVRDRLDRDGIAYEYLDGATKKRAQVIKNFREGDAPVFLISLKSGGFGLNLTEADYCILLDPWWNPAAEAQAVDRAHRIGQTRQVMVYRFVAKGTIEEKVMALKAGKSQLFESVMSDGAAAGTRLSADDIRSLLE